MTKLSLLLAFLIPLQAVAQPTGYYNSSFGKNGEPLRRALYDIIKNYTVLTYTPGLWDAYYTTDVKTNGKLASIYSDKPGSTPPYEFTLGTDQCSGSTPSTEGGCYNREHTWPQSKFGGSGSYPMYSDLWLVYPTDSKVNGQRADFPYGNVTSPAWTSMNGSKLGPNTFTGAPSTTAFEPIDSFKGDIARTYFYITTRYFGDSASFIDWEMATKSTLKPWAIQMLLQWHRLDPVSTKEKTRNEAVYALQNNRNPFVDDARFAECIWAGNCLGLAVPGIARGGGTMHISPNPAKTFINIDWVSLAPDEVLAVDVLNIQGQVVLNLQDLRKAHADIDISAWPGGLYFVQMRTRHGVQVEKVVVE